MGKKQSQFDPDKLALTKEQILDFCDRVIEKWNKNPSKNAKNIFAMNAVKTSVLWTDDDSLKAIWGEIMLGCLSCFMRMHWLKAKMKTVIGQMS